MEASTGIEPVYTDLQSAASPLRQLAAGGVMICYLILRGAASVTNLQKHGDKRCRMRRDVRHLKESN